MKPALIFLTTAVLGFAVTLQFEASANTDANDNSSGKATQTGSTSNGGRLVAMSQDNTVRIWDLPTGKSVSVPLSGITAAQFSPDGKQIVTTSSDKTVRIWDAATGRLISEDLTLLKRSQPLSGAWQLISFKSGEKGKLSEVPVSQRRIKFITDKHFSCIAYDATSGKVQSVAGGTYILGGPTYTETVDYVGEGSTNYSGTKQSFTIRVEADKLYQSNALSDGTIIEEVWERVE
jgi:WD40 repeat protein